MEPLSVHVPVLLREVLELLRPQSGGIYVDGTLGGGGHTEAISRLVGPSGLVVAMDRDLTTIERTEKRLEGERKNEKSSSEFSILHSQLFDNTKLL
jgi:16S rRNA (cytosine1402-N4)-methyltransferase